MPFPLRNIEFSRNHHGDVEYRLNDGTATKLEADARELIDSLFSKIEEDYPKAFAALSAEYAKSKANVPYFKFLVVRRFLLCNFSRLDRRLDIDEFGRFNFEEIDCPLICECRNCGVICHPEFDTRLTARQREVMKLYCEGYNETQIAERLYMSPATVETTKRNAFNRADVHSLAEFMTKFNGKL